MGAEETWTAWASVEQVGHSLGMEDETLVELMKAEQGRT